MSITGKFNSKIGEIKVEILDGGGETHVEINSIGDLKYEFDLIPDSPEVDSVQALYNKIDIEVFQHSFDKEDIYERIRTNLIDHGGAAVNLTVDGDIFPFFIRLNDISLSEVERTIKLDCRVRYNPDATVLEVFDRIESEDASLLHDFVPDQNNETEILDCAGVADWIDAAMREIFLNDYEGVVQSAEVDLPENYNQENYTSTKDGFPTGKIGHWMVRMTSPPFSALQELPEDQQQIQPGLIQFIGDWTFKGSGFEGTLIVGGSIRLVNTIGQQVGFWIVDEVVSDTEFKITTQFAPPSFGFYYYNLVAELKETTDVKALGALQELAAIEGSIFGTGFGRNFFVNRLKQADVVTINWRDVVDFDTTIFYNPVGGGLVRQLARTFNNVATGDRNEGTETFGTWPVSDGEWEMPLITDGKTQLEPVPGNDTRINLRLAPAYPFLSKARAGALIPFGLSMLGKYGNPVQWFNDFAPTLALCRSGLEAIKKSLFSDGSGDVIEFEVFGAKTIKPWNLVRFSGAPAKYSNKLFRPTSLEYDLVNDTAKCTAYEIVQIASPINEITVSGNVHASGSIVEGDEAVMVSGNSHASGQVDTGDDDDFEFEDELFYMTSRASNTDKKVYKCLGNPEDGITILETWNFPSEGELEGVNEAVFRSSGCAVLRNGNVVAYASGSLNPGRWTGLWLFDRDLNLLNFVQRSQSDVSSGNTTKICVDADDSIMFHHKEGGGQSIIKYDKNLSFLFKIQVVTNNQWYSKGLQFTKKHIVFIIGRAFEDDIIRFYDKKTGDFVKQITPSINWSNNFDNCQIINYTDGRFLISGDLGNGDNQSYLFDENANILQGPFEIGLVAGMPSGRAADAIEDGTTLMPRTGSASGSSRLVHLDSDYNEIWSTGNFGSQSNGGLYRTTNPNVLLTLTRTASNNTGAIHRIDLVNQTVQNLGTISPLRPSSNHAMGMIAENWQVGSPPEPFIVSGNVHASGTIANDANTISPHGNAHAGGQVQTLKLAAPGVPDTKEILVGGETNSSGEVNTTTE
jgi:hypothetical protein